MQILAITQLCMYYIYIYMHGFEREYGSLHYNVIIESQCNISARDKTGEYMHAAAGNTRVHG